MLQVRVILGLLTFGMFFTYQLSRFNINIAIVAMTNSELKYNSTESEFDEKAIVLGAFFYLSCVTELVGSYLLIKFGCRYVMALTFGLNAICCFLFPWSYRLHPLFGAFIRLIQGLALGTTWPAVAWLSSRWIPKHERSRFMSAYHGAPIGASFSNLVGGLVIDKWGWPYVFYGTGILSLVWVLLWWPFAYDSPSLHPRISKEELEYLQKHVEITTNTNSKKTSKSTPWIDIFTSIPFWSVSLMFFCLLWFIITLAMQMPTYFDEVHHLDIKTNGLILSISDILKATVGIIFPTIIDNLIKKNKITVTTARKLSSGIGNMVPAILLILIAFYGKSNITIAAGLFTSALAINGAGSSSILANMVDISPNHASVIVGIAKSASNIPGIISPIVANYILAADNENWGAIFLLCSAMMMCSCVFYLFFTSTDIQPWNDKENNVDENLDMLEKSLKNIPLNDLNTTNLDTKTENMLNKEKYCTKL